MKLSCKVVDKRKKDGWFSVSYFVTLKIIDVKVANSPSHETRVPISQYYDLEVGSNYTVTVYRHSNGLYYTAAE